MIIASSSTYVGVLAALSPIISVYLGWRLQQVHKLVNAQHSALEARVEQLKATIETSDQDVPPTTRETGR